MEWRFSFAMRDATRGFPHSHAHRRNMEGPVYVDSGHTSIRALSGSLRPPRGARWRWDGRIGATYRLDDLDA